MGVYVIGWRDGLIVFDFEDGALPMVCLLVVRLIVILIAIGVVVNR